MKKTIKVLLSMLAVMILAVFPCFGIRYIYDSVGRVTDASYDEEMELSYTYDRSGNIKRIRRIYSVSFEIEFIANGGSEVGRITAMPGDYISEPNEPERFGYNFLGWFIDENCTQKYNFVKMPARNLVLYAGWEVNEDYAWYMLNPSADLFEIQTEGELRSISNIVYSKDDFSGKTISVKNDIQLTYSIDDDVYLWTPIGTEENRFNGTFDGNAHTISNVLVNSSEGSLGLFGVIGEEAIIKELKLSNINIEGKDNIGSIAGTSYGLIINCLTEGSVNGNKNVGGIVGNNSGDIVNIGSNTAVNGNDFVGGAVGTNNGNVMLCVVSGDICEFKTDNFGMFTGFSSEAGHEGYSVYPSAETSQKTMQVFGLNSIYEKSERSSIAYFFYYEENEKLPDVESGYIAQLKYVWEKINKAVNDVGTAYKGIELIMWNKMDLNEQNIPCVLNF